MTDERIVETRTEPAWQLPAIIVLGLIALGGLAFGWNASSKLDSTQQSVASQLKAEAGKAGKAVPTRPTAQVAMPCGEGVPDRAHGNLKRRRPD